MVYLLGCLRITVPSGLVATETGLNYSELLTFTVPFWLVRHTTFSGSLDPWWFPPSTHWIFIFHLRVGHYWPCCITHHYGGWTPRIFIQEPILSISKNYVVSCSQYFVVFFGEYIRHFWYQWYFCLGWVYVDQEARMRSIQPFGDIYFYFGCFHTMFSCSMSASATVYGLDVIILICYHLDVRNVVITPAIDLYADKYIQLVNSTIYSTP